MRTNILYFDIVSYISLLCIFIVFFVISIIIYLSFFVVGVRGVDSDSSLLELVWTIIPTFGVFGLCALKVKFILRGVEGEVGKRVKIIGRQ